MRIELNIPESSRTPLRRSKYTQLAVRRERQPEFIDAIPIEIATEKLPRKQKNPETAPLTDDELGQFNELFPNFAIRDITDEQWQRIEKDTLKMRRGDEGRLSRSSRRHPRCA